MKERTIASINGGTTGECTTVADLKLRMAEHIIAQYDHGRTTDVQNILAETKVGAWKRPTLLKKLKMVFETT